MRGENVEKFSAGILAGGKSRRMGRNKALLAWQDSIFLEHFIHMYEKIDSCSQIMVSVAEEDTYRRLFLEKQIKNCRLLSDVRQEYGPLEGLYRLLLAAENPWVFVSATDLPLLDAGFVEKLYAQRREGIWAVIPRTGERVHPLCGLYSRQVLPVLEQLFERGDHKVMCLLEGIPVQYIEVESHEAEVLQNVNTPEEYEKIIRTSGGEK